MAELDFTNIAPASINTPASGVNVLFSDTNNTLIKKNSAGVSDPIYPGRALSASHANPWFDVTQYGTVDKTGVADSTAAFTAAMTAIAASPRGGVLYVPAGLYLVNTGTIDFSTGVGSTTAPVAVVGADRALSLIFPNGTGDVIKLHTGSDGCSIQNIGIWSSGATQTAGNAINTNGANDVLISNVLFNNQFVDVNVNNSSIKVDITHTVHTHGVNNGANSVGILVTNGAAGDTYVGPDVVMSDTGATRRRASVEVTQSGHFEINQCNLTGSAQGLLVDPGAATTVAFGFCDYSLFDSCTVNGATLNATTGTSVIKSIKFSNCWFSGTTSGAGQAGFLTAGTGAGVVDTIDFVQCRFLNNQTHGLQHGFGTGLSIIDCDFKGNSAAGSNTSDGINIATTLGGFKIIGCKSGGTDAAPTGGNQRYGITVTAGTAVTGYIIEDNDLTGNNTGGLNDGGVMTGFGQKIVKNNLAHNVKGLMDAMTAATAGLNTTLTLLYGGLNKAPLLANALVPTDSFRFRIWGTNTSSVAGITTITVRIGTAGTTADAAIVTVALPISAAAGTTIPFEIEGLMTIRTIGAAATVHGTARLHNQSVTSNATASTGISVFSSQVIIPTFATFNSTVSNYISICHVTAAATTTNTIQGGFIEWL